MLSGFTGWHALVLLVIVVLLFGATKLPGLAKSVGQSMKIFKNEVKGADEPVVPPATPAGPVNTAPSAVNPQLNQTSPEVRAQTDQNSNTTP